MGVACGSTVSQVGGCGRKDLLLMLNPALLYWRINWLQEDRLREAEAARMAALARQLTVARPTRSSLPKRELELCTAS